MRQATTLARILGGGTGGALGAASGGNLAPTQARVFGGVAGGKAGIAGGATSAIVNAGFN